LAVFIVDAVVVFCCLCDGVAISGPDLEQNIHANVTTPAFQSPTS